MILARAAYGLASLLLAAGDAARAKEAEAFIQPNISAAKILMKGSRYVVEISLTASDVEEMFMTHGSEHAGVNLSPPGALEREIGKFVARRVAMRDKAGAACAQRVEQSGEDPKNDEGVLVVVSFDCGGTEAAYDASKLLATQGPKAWQVVTIENGDAKKQVMVNAESSALALSDAR